MRNDLYFRGIKETLVFIVCLVCLAGASLVNAQTEGPEKRPNAGPQAALIVTSDIALFWKAYDRAKPDNDLIVYRDDYLKKGSLGLQDFTKSRIGSSCNLLAAIEAAPKYYAALREPSLKIDSYKTQIEASFERLKQIYPAAIFPDVYFVIGRMTSGGTVSANGILIGVDMYGKNPGAPLDELDSWHKAVVKPVDEIPYIVAHEIIHSEQKYLFAKNSRTLLAQSIAEGSADFIGQLIAGKIINSHLHEYGNPRERELWLEFEKEMNGADVGNWLYQGDKAKGKPADLGYYVGYKIVENFYKNALDKTQAVKDILEIKDFQEFLKASRYEEKFLSAPANLNN